MGQVIGAILAMGAIAALYLGLDWMVTRWSGRKRPQMVAGILFCLLMSPVAVLILLVFLGGNPK